MLYNMSTRSSRVHLQGLVQLFRRYRSQAIGSSNNSYRLFPPPLAVPRPLGRNYEMGQVLSLIGSRNVNGATRNFSISPKTGNDTGSGSSPAPLPPPPPSPWSNFPVWVRWTIGSALAILLPFLNKKWKQLKKIEGEAEQIVEGAEVVAEVVENVAKTVEKMTEEVAEKLPDDSKLKEAAKVVEHISEIAAHDAQVTEDVLHKVDQVKQDLDDLEAMVEPVADKIVGDDKPKPPTASNL